MRGAGLIELIASPGGPPVLVLLCDTANRRALLQELSAALPEGETAVLELSAGDNSPGRFEQRLAAALSPFAGRQGFDELSDAADLLAAALNSFDARAGRQTSLILVGYERITSEAVHRGVARLLDFLPPGLRVVFCSLAIPPVGIPRLVVRRRAMVFTVRAEPLERA